MTIDDVFKVYKPKEGYKIMKGTLERSGRYFASVFKEVVMKKGIRTDIASISVKNVATTSVEEYVKQLEPYIELREPIV